MNFQTQHEIEEMVLLYGLPSGSSAAILEIPLSLLQFIQAIGKLHTERVLNGELHIHWKGNCWWIVPGSFVPFDESSASVRRAVVSRGIRGGSYRVHHVMKGEVKGDLTTEKDLTTKGGVDTKRDAVPGSSASIQASGSNRSANQSQESRVQNACHSSGLNLSSIGSPRTKEEEPHRTEVKEKDEQQKELPTHGISLENVGARTEEVHMCRSRNHSPKTRTDLPSQSDTLNDAPENGIPHSVSEDSTIQSQVVEENDLVTQEKLDPVPDDMPRRDSDDKEWLWLNEEHD